VVVPKAGSTLSPSDLGTHCRKLIAGYKVPRSYDIRSQPLPLSAVGKVQKTLLREEWLAADRAKAK
jgi:acyl-CoA synthetase (AMP-forming)/AMP-acid ligase II